MQGKLELKVRRIPPPGGEARNVVSPLGENYHDIVCDDDIIATFVGTDQNAINAFARRFLTYKRLSGRVDELAQVDHTKRGTLTVVP